MKVFDIKGCNKLSISKATIFKQDGIFMLAVNYSTLKSNLKKYCDKTTDRYETVIITRKDKKNVVLLSLEKYNAITKAARNAEYLDKIDKNMAQITQGKVVFKTMEELEEMTAD
jgi:antitoxin YefM